MSLSPQLTPEGRELRWCICLVVEVRDDWTCLKR